MASYVIHGFLVVACALHQQVFGLAFPGIVPTPPTWPQAFSVSFSEILKFSGEVLAKNNGTWYYDYANRRARFVHGRGQRNSFCARQGLSPKDPQAPCSLVFLPGNMYVFYQESWTCCRLCGTDEGCTILKPDWIHSGSVLLSVETINGVKCYGYGKHGAVSVYDVLYSDESGTMCRYHEVVRNTQHNLTFYRDTYKVGPQPDWLFDIPKICSVICPHPFPQPPN
ncbi:secreted protein [Plakobranchus ocellatus]|uniref:Secreted protein n=1 Tax=Plakobranchus ocellatus TaxID=259542 RepID=A0AAV3ZSQ4_9GAST|nr:secreted protein [Plakobranchus ocellatus]